MHFWSYKGIGSHCQNGETKITESVQLEVCMVSNNCLNIQYSGLLTKLEQELYRTRTGIKLALQYNVDVLTMQFELYLCLCSYFWH